MGLNHPRRRQERPTKRARRRRGAGSASHPQANRSAENVGSRDSGQTKSSVSVPGYGLVRRSLEHADGTSRYIDPAPVGKPYGRQRLGIAAGDPLIDHESGQQAPQLRGVIVVAAIELKGRIAGPGGSPRLAGG